MAYPERGAKYAGEDRAAKLCRADGGRVDPRDRAQTHLRNMANFDAKLQENGVPPKYRPQEMDMRNATQISDAVPRRKE